MRSRLAVRSFCGQSDVQVVGLHMGFSSHQPGPMADINVTPMVDVMLVLLIIFMVTAPMAHEGVEVDLPAANAPAMNTSTEQPLILTLTKDNRAFLGKTEIPMDRITEMLAANDKLRADKELFLHADQSLPYGVVVKVMAAAKAGGADSLAMVTDPAGVEIPR
jgi:biopolymer transport protein TolR